MSTTDESDDDKFGLGDQTDFEVRREPDWQWSTGRSDNSLVNKKAKKRFIIPGEKKQMKKLHMARLREERAERKMSRRKEKQGARRQSIRHQRNQAESNGQPYIRRKFKQNSMQNL